MVTGIGAESRIRGHAHHRTSAAPQVKPPPIASSSTRSPRLMRPSVTATQSASGIEAADVLPWRSTRHHDLLRRDAELVRRGVDDALVGLVRHEPVDVVGSVAGVANTSSTTSVIIADRVPEDLAAFHAQMPDGLRRGRAAIDVELGLVAAVGAQVRGEDAAVRRARPAAPALPARRRRRRRRTARRCVRSFQSRMREKVSAPITSARLCVPVRSRPSAVASAIDKARADRLQVERRAVGDAEARLDRHRGRGKRMVRRRGREHDEIDRLRIDVGVRRAPRAPRASARSEVSSPSRRDVPLADAGALHDPLVGGVDQLRADRRW